MMLGDDMHMHNAPFMSDDFAGHCLLLKKQYLTHSSVLTFKLCCTAIVIVNLGMFVIAADPGFAVSVETSESSSRCVGRGGGRPSSAAACPALNIPPFSRLQFSLTSQQ